MPSMCTGPCVCSLTRFAIRNASTTPWQYPRGVILRTSMGGFEFTELAETLDPHEEVVLRQRRSRLAPRELVVLGPKRQLVDLVGHRREPRVGVVLAHMRGKCLPLALRVPLDVDPGRHEL